MLHAYHAVVSLTFLILMSRNLVARPVTWKTGILTVFFTVMYLASGWDLLSPLRR